MTNDERDPSGRPERGEYADYAEADVALVRGDDAVTALEATEAETVSLFDRVSEERARGLTYAPGKWTLKEVLGHLIDDERIFAYRALCVARQEPLALPGFDQELYVSTTRFESRTLASLIAEYRAVRAASIAFFSGLAPEEWVRRGTVNGYPATPRGLAFHIAGHELHHLGVLRERYGV